MRIGNTALSLAVTAVLVAVGSGMSVAQPAGPALQADPAYSLEGAWYGMVSIEGLPPTPSLDTFTANARRAGREGTMLCTIHAWQMPLPDGVVLSFSPSCHGNWVRTAKNTFAFTCLRSIVDQAGMAFGWARFWGTVTPTSRDEYSGTMNAQFYKLDGTPLMPQDFKGTLASRRIAIQPEGQN